MYYGRKLEGASPGTAGTEISFADMLTTAYTATRSTTSLTCDVATLGDPLAGYTKRCWCAPRGYETLCAAQEGDACECSGTVYMGHKFTDDSVPPGTGAITDFATLSESFGGAETYAAK